MSTYTNSELTSQQLFYLNNSVFVNNSALNGRAISNEAEGGNTNNAFNIFGTFIGNQASSCSGAIYSSLGKSGNSPYGGTNVYTISTTFNGNSTSDLGGAIGTFTKNKFIGSGLLYRGGYENNMSMEGKKDSLSNWFFSIAMKCAYNFDVNFTQSINITLEPNFLTSFNLYGNSKWNSDYGQINMNSGYLKGLM